MSMGADDVMRVQFSVSLEDVEAIYRLHWKAQGGSDFAIARLRERRKLWFGLTIVGAAICFGYLIAMAMDWTAVRGQWLAGCVVVTLYGWWTWTNTREEMVHAHYHAAMKKQMQESGTQVLLGPVSLAVTIEGIETVTSHHETKYNWSMVLNAVAEDEAVLIHLVGGNMIRIPRRAFAAPAEPTQFRDLINARIAEAGFSPSRRIVCYINSQKLSCSDCKYPLHGLADAKCPECGKEFTLTEFPAAAGVIP